MVDCLVRVYKEEGISSFHTRHFIHYGYNWTIQVSLRSGRAHTPSFGIIPFACLGWSASTTPLSIACHPTCLSELFALVPSVGLLDPSWVTHLKCWGMWEVGGKKKLVIRCSQNFLPSELLDSTMSLSMKRCSCKGGGVCLLVCRTFQSSDFFVWLFASFCLVVDIWLTLVGYVPGAIRTVMHSAALGVCDASTLLSKFTFLMFCMLSVNSSTTVICWIDAGIIIPRMKSMAGGVDFFKESAKSAKDVAVSAAGEFAVLKCLSSSTAVWMLHFFCFAFLYRQGKKHHGEEVSRLAWCCTASLQLYTCQAHLCLFCPPFPPFVILRRSMHRWTIVGKI